MKTFIICLLALLCYSSRAQIKTWTAGASGNWSNGANWSGSTAPTAADSVVLSGLSPNIIITIDNTAVCGALTMGASSSTTGTILQFPSSGSVTLTISKSSGLSGALLLSGGSGTGQGTRPKITSNGNSIARLNVEGNITTSVSNAASEGNAGLNMNEGIVAATGSANSTISSATGFRLGNFQIGDGTNLKKLTWAPTASGTMLVLSLTVKAGCTLYIGTTNTQTNPIGGNPALTGGVTIESAGSLIVQNASAATTPALLTVAGGGITNNGTLSLVSTDGSRALYLSMTATSAQTIGGTGTFSLKRLIINDTLGVTVNSALSLADSLIMTFGNITLGTSSITIALPGGANPGSPSSYVVTSGTGTLTQKSVGAADFIFPVGTANSYNPVIINNAGTVDTFSVRVQSTFDFPPPNPNTVVNRQWTIRESVPGGSNATITLQWNTTDQAGGFNPANPVYIGRYDGTYWGQIPATVLGVGPYLAYASGFTTFSPFGIGNNNALPIQLASFTGSVGSDRRVHLAWSTASEVNNYGFYVERKDPAASEWTLVENSFVAGHGTTNVPHRYTFTDNELIIAATQYRLKQVDLDNTVHFSDPVLVSLTTGIAEQSPAAFRLGQNYPNPFNPSTEIQFSVQTTGPAKVNVTDLLGREVAVLFDGRAEAGVQYKVRFIGASLGSGVYYYRMQSGPCSEVRKLLLLK